MKLAMEVFTGRFFYIEIEEGATIADLKAQIEVQENFPRRRLILMLDTGEEHTLLENDAARLGDSGIQDGSHIYIFFGVSRFKNEIRGGDDDGSHTAHSDPLSPKEVHSSPKEVPSSPKEAPLSPKEASSSTKEAGLGKSSSPKDGLNEPPSHDNNA